MLLSLLKLRLNDAPQKYNNLKKILKVHSYFKNILLKVRGFVIRFALVNPCAAKNQILEELSILLAILSTAWTNRLNSVMR